jgi:CHAT domain-containing protein/Tfp pilus assembly protein PilF
MIHRIPETCTAVRSLAFVFLAIALCYLSLPSYAQKPHAPKAKPLSATEKVDEKSTVEPGVVVEEVEAGREGDKAGLKVGDVILGWSRGDAAGKIESPFDFIWVDIEQRPRSIVTLEGMREGEKASWTLGSGEWGITARPIFTGRLLNTYEKARELAKIDHKAKAAKYWQRNSHPLPDIAWLPAWSEFFVAKLFREAEEFVLADDAYRKAVRLSNDASLIAKSRILNSWGGMYCHRGDMVKAGKLFHASVDALDDDVDDSLMKAFYMSDLGAVLAVESDFDSSILLQERALAIRRKNAPSSREVGESLSRLGSMEATRRDLTAAREYFKEALALQERYAPDSFAMGKTLNDFAGIAADQGDLAEAEKYGRRALSIWAKIDPRGGDIAVSLLVLGNVALSRDDLMSAKKFYHEALSISRQLPGEKATVAVILANLGLVALAQGKVDDAFAYGMRGLEIQKKLSMRESGYVTILTSVAEALVTKGDLKAGRKLLAEAGAIENQYHKDGLLKAIILRDLGDLDRRRGNNSRAISRYRGAEEILRKTAPNSVSEAETLGALAELSATMRDFSSARAFYESSFLAFESQAAKLGAPADTVASYRANHGRFYRNYVDLLVQQDQPQLAFEVSEKSRARTLLETLSIATVAIHQGADPELLKRERAFRSEIKAKSDHRVHMLTQQHSPVEMKTIESEIADLTRQYDEVEENLRSTSPNYSALTQPKPLSTQEIQRQLLDKDTVLVEYSLGEKRSYAFVVTPDSLTAHELPSRLKIEQAARRLHRLLKNEDSNASQMMALAKPGTTSKTAQAESIQRETQRTAALLSRMVLDPIAGEIGNKRLLIVADGALHYIPFSALPEPSVHEATLQRSPQPVPPLIVNHEIILLPSASVLAVLRKQQESKAAPTGEVAVLADPVFDKADARVLEAKQHSRKNGIDPKNKTAAPIESAKSMYDLATPPLTRSLVDVGLGRGAGYHLPRLRYTRREAEAIYAQVPQGSAMKALDFDASRATATSADLSRYRIVHFATHGLLNSEHPELSGLVLSLVDRDGRPQDGFLGLQDIYNLNLPADLVVLSACETGLGKEISGEGLVGLTRGFMYAGATRVVASLWKVSDAATAALMAEFYRSMEQDHLAPAAALRQAQISMWKQKRWSDPYYWAAFQIQGEWK